jgi:hypothetical protein
VPNNRLLRPIRQMVNEALVLMDGLSAQSPQACGTLAMGWALKRSTSRMARLLRRSSPRSIVSNSVPAQPIFFLQIFFDGILTGFLYNEMASPAPIGLPLSEGSIALRSFAQNSVGQASFSLHGRRELFLALPVLTLVFKVTIL